MHNIEQKISVIHVELYCHVSWMGDDFHALAAAAVHNHILYNKVSAKVHLRAFIEAVIKNTRSVFFSLIYWKQMKRLSYRLRCGNIFGNFRTRSTIFGNVRAAPGASGAGNRKRHNTLLLCNQRKKTRSSNDSNFQIDTWSFKLSKNLNDSIMRVSIARYNSWIFTIYVQWFLIWTCFTFKIFFVLMYSLIKNKSAKNASFYRSYICEFITCIEVKGDHNV